MEYVSRLRLAALGYKSDLADLSCIKADAFILIDLEYNALQADEQKNAMAKIKVKGRR